MIIKILLLVVFFAVMFGVGVYCKKHATNVSGFVLGGRSVGPWMTAFAYGTSYFSAVVFIGYAGQFGWKFGLSSTWIGIGNAVIGSLLARLFPIIFTPSVICVPDEKTPTLSSPQCCFSKNMLKRLFRVLTNVESWIMVP